MGSAPEPPGSTEEGSIVVDPLAVLRRERDTWIDRAAVEARQALNLREEVERLRTRIGELDAELGRKPSVVSVDNETVAVLREHVAFLREQLAAKQPWFEGLLRAKDEELGRLRAEAEALRKRERQLTASLAEARALCSFNNTLANDGNAALEVRDDVLGRWTDLIVED